MRTSRILPMVLVLLVIFAAGCGPGGAADDSSSTPVPQTPTNVPTATNAPPTETQPPPTETAVPVAPIEIDMDQLAGDGCPLVTLNAESWAPLHAAYTASSDPFYQFHDNESGFYFNVELYTVYGSGWTGQTGTFKPDCNRNGICVYLVPDDVNPYLATAGEVTITSLGEENGTLKKPVEITMVNLTLKPVPGSKSQGCYHVDEVSINIGE
jgi:hypothetical protein